MRRCNTRRDGQVEFRGQLVECPADSGGPWGLLLAPVKGEERAIGSKSADPCLCAVQVIADRPCHTRSEGNQPALSKFRLANHQELLVEINVLSLQSARFAHPQAQSVEEGQDHPVGFTPIGKAWITIQLSSKAQKTSNLVRVEEKWLARH